MFPFIVFWFQSESNFSTVNPVIFDVDDFSQALKPNTS